MALHQSNHFGHRLCRLAVVALTLGAAAPVAGAHAQSSQATADWRFQSRARVDLWYHGLAVIGYEGFGLLPLYDHEYVSTIHEAKVARGVGSTPLDSLARHFLTEFDRDSVFEVLHFVPLYFERGSPEAMLDALTAVARGREPTSLGAEIVSAVFTSAGSRELLGEYVAVLRQEWALFFEAYWNDGAEDRDHRLEAAQRLWDEQLAAPLQRFLVERRLASGRAFTSAAVGAEGRVFVGAPRDQRDNRVAVWLPRSSGGPDAMVFALVRELCFPLVSQVVTESGSGGWDRVIAERLSSYGAVRCGADLLERVAPALVPAYQQAFVRAADEPRGSTADFATVFPVDAELLRQILAVLEEAL